MSVLNMQNLKPEAEELIFSHYVVCNDTQETLCFGQLDTDESVVLSSGQSHQYCWRSHKAPQVTASLCHCTWSLSYLHACMHLISEQRLMRVFFSISSAAWSILEMYLEIPVSVLKPHLCAVTRT